MDILGAFCLASLLGAALIAFVIHWSTNQAAAGAITRHFKASEFILETGQPPPEWYRAPAWKRLLRAAPATATSADMLARLDELIQFFEQCSFFEDEWAREQLLAQLAATRATWQCQPAQLRQNE